MSRLKLTYWQRRRLRRQLKEATDARLYRRTLAVLELDRGRSAADIADMLGVTRQSVSNWATASAHDLDPSALADRDRSGRPRLLTEDIEDLLRSLLASSPQHFGHQATTGTVPLLPHEVERSTGLWPSDDTIRRRRGRLGFVWKRPRYVLDPDPEREKETTDSEGNPGPAAPQRRAGPGRDRPPAVPAPEGRMGGAGRTGEGLAGRGQRATSGLRREEPGDGDAAIVAEAQGAEYRFPGVPRRGPAA
jgi:transposase